jgi:hypothetical protein
MSRCLYIMDIGGFEPSARPTLWSRRVLTGELLGRLLHARLDSFSLTLYRSLGGP